MEPNPKITSEEEAYKVIREFWREHIKSPAHILYMYDQDFKNNTYDLYKWQAKIHTEILNKTYTSENPLELCVQAVNGSGKDLFVLCLFETYFLMLQNEGVFVTTTSSGVQLKNQTQKYIVNLCTKINLVHGFEVFDIKDKHIRCNVTKTDLFLFVTDEAGKAEGYHPPGPGKPFAIAINEAKSIHPDIFEALERCTGYQYWIEISSPGKPVGHFYQMCNSTRNRTVTTTTDNIDSTIQVPAVTYIRVTAEDCPHLGTNFKAKIKELYGENSALYKSMVSCEFCSEDENVVLTYEKFNRSVKFQSEWTASNTGNKAGLDLSGGGDEQSLCIRNGNKIIKLLTWRIKDAIVLCNKLIEAFIKYNLKGQPIYADAGGLGKPIIDILHSRGWKNVKYILNQSNPRDQLAYANLGTEMWFKLANLFENNELCFTEDIIRDEILKKQLCSRYYKTVISGNTTVSQLESKAQAKAKGHPSPDRADSVALAFLNYETPTVVKVKQENRLRREANNIKPTLAIPTLRGIVDQSIANNNRDSRYKNSGIIYASKESFNIERNELALEIRQLLNQRN